MPSRGQADRAGSLRPPPPVPAPPLWQGSAGGIEARCKGGKRTGEGEKSIFHDVSLKPAAKTYHQDKLVESFRSELVTTTLLSRVDLSSTSLIKMGVTRMQLIDTDAIHYPLTAAGATIPGYELAMRLGVDIVT